MAELSCVDILRNITASCEATKQVGGADKRVWATTLGQIDSYTEDLNGYIDTLTMGYDGSSNQYKLIRVISKKNAHTATVDGTKSDTGVTTYNHTAVLKAYSDNPTTDAAIEDLFNAEDVVVFVEANYGQILVYGIEKGLSGTTLADTLGTLMTDDTGITITLAGLQRNGKKRFLAGGSLQTSIAYLDAISEAI